MKQTFSRTRPLKRCSRALLYHLGLVHTSDGIESGVGIGSARSVKFQCKPKRGIRSRVGSSTESESEGSEDIIFPPFPLPLPSLLKSKVNGI